MVTTNQKPIIGTQKNQEKGIQYNTKESHHAQGREKEKIRGE